MHKTFLFEKKSNEEIQKVIDNIYLIKILKKDDDELNKFFNTSSEVADGQLKKSYIQHIKCRFSKLHNDIFFLSIYNLLWKF